MNFRRRRLTVCLAGLIFLLALASSARVWALDPERPLTQAWLRIWQSQHGLTRATIFAIRQSSDGYIWLGSQAGLHRFDGMRFASIDEVSGISLKTLWIQDIYEDHSKNLWLATDTGGLIRMRDGEGTQFRMSDGLPSDCVRCLLTSRDGTLWIGTDAGLASYENGQFHRYPMSEGTGSNDVRALCEGPDGTIWIGGDGDRLSAWNGSKLTSTKLAAFSEQGSVRALYASPQGTVWIGTTSGLIRLQDGVQRRFTRSNGLADDWVHCLASAQGENIWVGTKDGISRVQREEIESFRTRDGLSQSTVYALCEDHEGSLWVGTKNGLNQFIDRKTIPYTMSEGLPSNDTGPILQDKSGSVWVGTLGAGLARSDGRTFTVAATTEQGLPSDTVLSLATGVDGELWIGTDKGLCRMNIGHVAETFTTEHGLPSLVVRSLYRDSSGVIWAGTSEGVAELRNGKFVRPSGDESVLRLPILAMLEERGHSLIVSTEGGRLYSIADHRMRPLSDQGKATTGIDALYQDAEGLIWTGTRNNGLGLIQGTKIVYITDKDGLYDDDISGIQVDSDDRMWMACSRGIFFVERSELKRFVAGETSKLKSTPFSPTKELRTVECRNGVQPSVWKMDDGRIWFSTISGVIVVDEANIKRALPSPSVLVEDVRINGQSMNVHEFQSLNPGKANLDFRYTALSFASPTRITFRYKLEGFDADWIDAGSRREAFYTNLPPGEYRFRVAAANGGDIWTEASEPVTFVLRPYFYQTRWFIPVCLILLGATGFAIFRLRVRQIKARLQVVLKERTRIARELHDTLIQGFSGVTMQMQALSARLRQSSDRETLDEVILDAGNCLREARRSVAGLRSATSNDSELSDSIAQTAHSLAEGTDIRLRLKLGKKRPQRLSADVEYNILRIVQEAISNAVKHSKGNSIEVRIIDHAQSTVFLIADDGVGFEVLNKDFIQQGHYGLIGMRERAAQIGAEIILESGAGRGTSIRLTVPMTVRASGGTLSPPGNAELPTPSSGEFEVESALGSFK